MKYLSFLALLALLGCGVDGPPIKPGTETRSNTSTSGLSITGRAKVGIIKRS